MQGKQRLFLLGGGLLAGVLIGALVLVLSANRPAQSSRRLPPTVGNPVPDFILPLLDGGSQRLSDLKGKPVVVNFWATWCGPCRAEMPLLDRYAAKYDGKLVVIGVNSEEKESVIRPFQKELGIRFPLVLDQTGSVTILYFVHDFPFTFFVDKDGVLRAQHLGQLDENVLVRYLKTIGIE